ncbi:MAG: cobaltochelatase subunit CobN [Candidatus Altarchaeum sp.]|nr:cobaltochelatase subunit CobN [Candidatus Altarchaeum sp.]
MEPIKIVSIMWASKNPTLKEASKNLKEENMGIDVEVYSTKEIEDDDKIRDKCIKSLENSNINLIYGGVGDTWIELQPTIEEIAKKTPTIVLGHDTGLWSLSTTKLKVVANVNAYMSMDGKENFKNMLKYMCNEILNTKFDVEPVKDVPWEGLFHPDAKQKHFTDIDEYLKWYEKNKFKLNDKPKVGILSYRSYWISNNQSVENALIEEFERQNIGVIPIFSYSIKDVELGNKGSGELIEEWLIKNGKSRINALINLQSFFLTDNRSNESVGSDVRSEKHAESGVEILKKLNVPVFHPIISHYKTEDEWRKDEHGLGTSVGWSIAMPEFEGVIEPIVIGARSQENKEIYEPIDERVKKVVDRIRKWIELQNKPIRKRKVAFIFNNNPCASVEATVGGGAKLDTLESVARIMHKMKKEGYDVNPPENGKELIETIMDRKAISEFRWTPVDEIIKKGGALKLITKEEYKEWFNTLKPAVRKKICETWGNPPGEQMGDMPPAMVYNGKIVVTGVEYGNVVVCVQPKRGCVGARCDGVVCKILHDPDVLPPHQYMATYRYLEYDFKADVIVHVGTHGNLEFLPGKSVGLSESCMPDVGIGNIPHLYIYNSDNPAEGTIAKRRSYATLVDHMQTVMTESGLYNELEEVERNLPEYYQAKVLNNKAKMHALQHILIENIKKAQLDKEIKLDELDMDKDFDEILERTHNALTRIRNTQIDDGMHIFGEIPAKERRIEFINGIMRYDYGEKVSMRRNIFEMMNLNYDEAMEKPAKYIDEFRKTYGELLDDADKYSKQFIDEILKTE